MEQAMNPLLSAWTRYLQRRAGGRRPSGPSAKNKPKSGRRTPRLERLEDRAVPAAYLVTTTADSGPGSLRDAITQVNTGLYNEIDFSLPWNDPGHVYYQGSVGNVQPVPAASASDADLTGAAPQWTHSWWSIQPTSPLPAITNPVTIDGYSQAGASGNTNPFGQADNAVLKVELNGSAGFAQGLGILAPNSTVRGLVINRFTNGGLFVSGAASGNDWLYGNFIGVDPTGTVNVGGGGIGASDTSNVTIGSASDGHDALERNLISGTDGGIAVQRSQGVTIQGNYLGTDATGNSAFTLTPILAANIFADGDTSLNILGNVISGGAYIGIDLHANLNGVVIQGNRPSRQPERGLPDEVRAGQLRGRLQGLQPGRLPGLRRAGHGRRHRATGRHGLHRAGGVPVRRDRGQRLLPVPQPAAGLLHRQRPRQPHRHRGRGGAERQPRRRGGQRQ
jgi:hypothetical protein